MTLQLFALYAVLWLVLFRALLVRANVLPPTCGRCGLHFERTHLGDRVCSCGG